jgi:hypothetical protein
MDNWLTWQSHNLTNGRMDGASGHFGGLSPNQVPFQAALVQVLAVLFVIRCVFLFPPEARSRL